MNLFSSSIWCRGWMWCRTCCTDVEPRVYTVARCQSSFPRAMSAPSISLIVRASLNKRAQKFGARGPIGRAAANVVAIARALMQDPTIILAMNPSPRLIR